ncbi:MAG: hypothetical protein K2X43_02585 [Hyphomonadaceae bacterium]|nr:hypothetical protein [Hyphomonadaceae bacterium]
MMLLARSARRLATAASVTCVCASWAAAQPQSAGSIEKLLGEGWEVAGYVSAWENRSLILFKHREHKYLVQCSVLIDVLRSPRLVTSCYEIR